MKKLSILFLSMFIVISLIGAVSAKDIAYVVKTTSNPAVTSTLDSLGYSYDIITDSQIAETNFDNYAMLVVQDILSNNENLSLNSRNTVFIVNEMSDSYYHDDITSLIWPTADVQKSSTIFARFEQLGTPFSEGFSSLDFQAYTLQKEMYYLKIKPANVNKIVVKDGSTSPYAVVAYSNNSNLRRVFFGFPYADYWTADTKKIFKNSVKWARLGSDFDGDGFYSDTDCNDNNASINPNATEIDYDRVDNDCKNGDLADVDGDGYCKQGYWIQNRFVQCANNAGSLGSDCDENNASINPSAVEIIDNVDQNCRNDAPFLISDISNVIFDEDENISIDLSGNFADYEGNALIFDVYNKSSEISAVFNGNIATLSAAKDWNGNGFVVFWARDSESDGNSNKVNLTILAVNDAPVLNVIPSWTIIEGDEIDLEVNAYDSDGDTLNYSINDSRFTKTGNVFVWNTMLGDAGTYNFLVSVSDGLLSDSKTFKVEVLRKLVINEFLPHPSTGDEWVEIYNPGSASFDLTGCYLEDAAYNHIQLSGSIAGNSFLVKEMSNKLNNDGDIIRLKCLDLLDEVSYGSGTGNVSIPGIDKSAGRVSDGLDSDSISDWKIYDYPTKGLSNSADMVLPIVNLISPVNNSVINLSYVLFNYTASDNKASQLNCSLYSDVNGTFKLLVSQTTVNGTKANFHANDVENGNYKWQVKCKDDRNTGESETWNFRVNVPKEPVISSIANITVNETETVTITVNATDSNPEDVLSYSINDIRFSVTGNIFTWQTGYGDAGTYLFNVSVSDGILTASQIVKVNVVNKNRAPVMQEIENQTINEDENLTIMLNASDEDNDNLTFSVKSTNLSEVKCIVDGKNLTLTPALNFNGNASCGIEVSDGSLKDSKNVFISVLAVNDAPVLKPILDITAEETQEVKVIANASDVDSSNLNYSINDSRFTKTENTFTWQTGYGNDGVYYFDVNVSDGLLSDSKTVKITVTDKNEPPHISPVANITVLEDSGFTDSIVLNAVDNDGVINRFEISQEDKNKADCTVSDKLLGVTPAKDFNGQASCKIKVYDDKNAYDETVVYILVVGVNDAPIISSYSPKFNPIIAENGKQMFSVSWNDTDNSGSDVSVKWYANNSEVFIGNSYEYNAQGKNVEIKAVVSDLNSSVEQLWQVTTSTIPIANSYDGNTTDFSGMSDSELANTNLILEKTGKGKIEFLEPVDLRDAVDFDNYADIQTGLLGIDTSYFPSLAGKLARIILYGLNNFDKQPEIYYNSGFTLNASDFAQLCGDKCKINSWNNGTLDFNSTFSSFKIGDRQSCSQLNGNVCSSGEVCSGNWLNAVENSCCSGTCMPKFSEIDKCNINISNEIEINIQKPKENEDFKIDEKIPVKIKISNDAEEDLDFDVEVYLYDLTTDEEIDTYDESLDVEEGKTETLELSITIPNDIDEGDDFAVFVRAEDEDFCQQNYQKISIDRNKHDVKIINFELADVINCGESVEATVNVENIGKEDESVGLEISNKELGVYEKSSFSLKESSEDKNNAIKRFVINIPDYAEEKTYNIVAKADFSGISKSVTRELNVKCEKSQKQETEETGTIRLSGITTQEVKAEKKTGNWLDSLNKMNATELTLVIVDIFLALGIIFIILYLLLRR